MIIEGWFYRFLLWREKHIKERHFILIVSFLVGVCTAASAIILKHLIHFIQHLLNAPLLVRQLIEAVVPFFIIIKDSLNLIKQQKRRGIVHQLEYLSVFPRISCPYFPDREQNRLFRHDQILLRHLIPGADIDPVILHLVPVAVVEDPLQMELIRQGLFILNREF